MSGVLYAVVGELIVAFAPELKASIGDGLRNLPNLGGLPSGTGEVVSEVDDSLASDYAKDFLTDKTSDSVTPDNLFACRDNLLSINNNLNSQIARIN